MNYFHEDRSIFEALADLFWIKLPTWLRRLSYGFTYVFVDGSYIRAWPKLAATICPLVFLYGFLVGWKHPGFQVAFTESLPVLLTVIAIGVLSAHLGGLFVAGFASGEILFFHGTWDIDVLLPSFIGYGLIAFMACQIPLITKGLLSGIGLSARLPRSVQLVLAFLFHPLLTLVLVASWVHALPVLIRPLFTWNGHSPSVEAMYFLQEKNEALFVVAVAASFVRLFLQTVAGFRSPMKEHIAYVESYWASLPPVKPLTFLLNRWIWAIVATFWTTLLLSGMITVWWEALFLGGVILFVQTAKERLLPLPLRLWVKILRPIPAVIRIAVGMTAIYFFSERFLELRLENTESFRPILILTAVSTLVFFLVHPGFARWEEQKSS